MEQVRVKRRVASRVGGVAVAVLLAAQALLPVQAHSVAGNSAEDVALATRVQAALLKAAPFQDNDVDLVVRASRGKVNLSGWVSDTGDDPLARKIAAGVPGVRSVTTSFHSWSTDWDIRTGLPTEVAAARAHIMATARSSEDLAVADRVKAALIKATPFQDPDVELTIRVAKGAVNISGWVSYASNEEQARKIAAAVTGVKTVSTNVHSWSTDIDSRL